MNAHEVLTILVCALIALVMFCGFINPIIMAERDARLRRKELAREREENALVS